MMKGIVLNLKHPDGIQLTEIKEPVPGPGEVKIKIRAAALNHRDQWCREGKYPNLKDGTVLGSDGVGEVVALGNEVDGSWLGKEVIINPAINWGMDQRVQSADFRILGMPDHGTFAEFVCAEVSRVYQKPAHLSLEEAAGLPLAGLTAFRAVSYHGHIQKGQRVLVTGFGGGVAQLAVQMALFQNAEVYVSSSQAWKINKALEMGAKQGFNYKEPNWKNEAKNQIGGFDLIIDSAMGDTFSDLLEVVKPGGSIVFYGATLGNPSQINMRKIFWNQIRIQGSTMGSDRDFEKMLEWVSESHAQPLVDAVFPLEDAVEAFERMKVGRQLGKLVLKI
ncbi:MAG: zinc-binding dehydrogenase [Cyclobacteriaceae bacterium]